jgi:site-specific DNA-adenine methylase
MNILNNEKKEFSVTRENKNNKEDIEYLKPIIKWIGGKTQILEQILAEFPEKIDNYHELFLGGGSVLFGLLTNIINKKNTVKKNIYAYDLERCAF